MSDTPGTLTENDPPNSNTLKASDGEVASLENSTGENTSYQLAQKPSSKRFVFIASLLFVLSLTGIVLPALWAFNYAVSAYETYTTLHDQAYSGVQHLLNVKTIFTGLTAHPTGLLDTSRLRLAQKEFDAAHHDFQQVQYILDHSALVQTITHYSLQYRSQVISVHALSQVGIDIAEIGQQLVSTALILAPTFRGPLLTDTSQPLVTPATLGFIRLAIDAILPRLSYIQAQSSQISFTALQMSTHQREQLIQLVQAIPQAEADLLQVRGLLDAAAWILGVDTPRTFLVQTMDRAELRPTGGFTGQYGELHIHAGRIGPFSLHDISFVEYVDNSPTFGQFVPQQYRSWWPFANWGLRDSNLSVDFPTSAQIAIKRYSFEVGHQVDGVILFTPFLIEHVLDVIGPVQMRAYQDTITAQNLEQRLHYYQQDNIGIRKQELAQHVEDPASARKLFTSLLAHTILDQVRHAPPDEIVAIARELLHDLKTKDIQVYVANPQIEGLLTQFGDAAQMNRSTTHDGLYIVQTNVSASKASQFVRTIIHDTVTLSANGAATHVMQLRLVYNQIGPVYGYDTYRDYVRVYVPPSTKFLWGDGFDTDIPLCGGPYVPCSLHDVYPKEELLCPSGQFQPGAAAPSLEDPNGGSWHPLDTVGPPTNFQSDEPDRAMFAGWVILPKNCTITVTLSWFVPSHAVAPYSLLVQRQAGTFPELDLTILPTPGNCAMLNTPGQYFDTILTGDTSFSLPHLPTDKIKNITRSQASSTSECYPQPAL